ncbi:HAMP domain-containing protein [Motiliproteus coralliicola]|uniref:histidine kinase n=1 Tax=Motiliproteus coralliicola TaxID=2283196 RepID=A0A369WR55_9GAMM|nr:cache domain-containing protein [Motiliproteus coralliicola]RDE24588.1 HAMP domain-containing protein [Motiliproteus coralliicola]
MRLPLRLSAITTRFFAMMLAMIATLFVSFYWYSVPLIEEKVVEIEHNASRIALNNIYELATRMHLDAEGYRQQALESQKQRLESVVSLTADFIASLRVVMGRQGYTEAELWPLIFQQLRDFRADADTYLWVADYDYRLLSHPADNFDGRDAAQLRDSDGRLIVPNLVELAINEGEGFYPYRWPKLGQNKELEKYSYVRHFPQWGIVIGSGVYLDEIEQQIKNQKEKALEDLRRAFEQITIANNGYLFVFDPQANMLIHPNPNIDGQNFAAMNNPVSGRPMVEDLIAVSDSGNEAIYRWDSPEDPGNYIYDKLSLVRHIPGFDWYISSSVYVDDLRSSAELLSTRIMVIAALALILASLMALVFADWITEPIRRLSRTAARVSRGQLNAKSGIRRSDELGLLAETFDSMVDQLSGNIQTLDERVQKRTAQLQNSNQELMRAFDDLQATRDELEILERRQRMILDALPAQVAYIDTKQRFVFANRGYAQMFGLEKQKVVGERVETVLGTDMYEEVRPHIEQALAGHSRNYEHRAERNGEPLITRRVLLPFYDIRGDVSGILNLSIDITKEKQTEARLAEANRMHAVGQMSGGIAHDFNNLLTIILGNLLELQEKLDQPELADRHLAPAVRATRRGADITRRLLAFARRQPLAPQRLPCKQLLAELQLLLSPSLPDSIELEISLAANTPAVDVDPGRFEDALVNLILNSRYAMTDGGKLLLRVASRTLDPSTAAELNFDETPAAGSYVSFRVIDQGSGFADEALIRGFEPFFTTKQTGAGSGLGLSMVYGFVKQSLGYIRLANHSEGAEVEILLPAVNADAQPLALPASSQSDDQTDSAPSQGLVLLVEDNQDLRCLIRDQLIELGMVVIEAANGDEALTLLDSIDDLSGLVTDLMLPGTAQGIDVALQASQVQPQAFQVLMTGYSEALDDPQLEDRPLLLKPFDKTCLQQALVQAQQRLRSH